MRDSLAFFSEYDYDKVVFNVDYSQNFSNGTNSNVIIPVDSKYERVFLYGYWKTGSSGWRHMSDVYWLDWATGKQCSVSIGYKKNYLIIKPINFTGAARDFDFKIIGVI